MIMVAAAFNAISEDDRLLVVKHFGFSENLTDEVLAHHGILGMKWGIRNDDRSSGRPQGGPSKKKAPLASVKKMIGGKPKELPSSSTKSFEVETKGQKVAITYDSNKVVMDANGENLNKANPDVSDEELRNEVASINKQLIDASTKLDADITIFKLASDKKPESSSNGGMSDEELRSAIARMQMEKTYKQLVAEQNPPPPKKPESVIKRILADTARQATGEILKSTVTAIGKYAIAAAISTKNPALATAILAKNEGNWASKKPAATSQNGSTTTSTTDMTPSDAVKKILDEMERLRKAPATP
jgi:hypothetical protein